MYVCTCYYRLHIYTYTHTCHYCYVCKHVIIVVYVTRTVRRIIITLVCTRLYIHASHTTSYAYNTVTIGALGYKMAPVYGRQSLKVYVSRVGIVVVCQREFSPLETRGTASLGVHTAHYPELGLEGFQ